MGNKQSKVHEILPFEMSTTVLFKWDRSNERFYCIQIKLNAFSEEMVYM